jgi:transposase
VWREVHVPSVADEAARHASRERTQRVQERTRVVNQLRSWLATVGAKLPARRRAGWWTIVTDWAGAALAPQIQARIARAEDRLAGLAAHLAVLATAERAAAQAAAADRALGRLVRLSGVAAPGAQVLLEEGLVWRAFRNRREIGGLLGFAPLPYQSGEQARDQGIDRAGNSRWRAISLQLAWNWVQWQPTSALTQGYQRRFGGGGARLRRIGIVALARKWVIALWRTAMTGEVPAGAVLKVA